MAANWELAQQIAPPAQARGEYQTEIAGQEAEEERRAKRYRRRQGRRNKSAVLCARRRTIVPPVRRNDSLVLPGRIKRFDESETAERCVFHWLDQLLPPGTRPERTRMPTPSAAGRNRRRVLNSAASIGLSALLKGPSRRAGTHRATMGPRR